jgi:hypothetical protein
LWPLEPFWFAPYWTSQIIAYFSEEFEEFKNRSQEPGARIQESGGARTDTRAEVSSDPFKSNQQSLTRGGNPRFSIWMKLITDY